MNQKKLPILFAWIAFLSPSLMNAQQKTEFIRVEELQPGMKGIGKTCVQGANPEEFQVEILGVLRGIEPGANAVLAKLAGDPVDKTGVFEGMSGSPVFIDGKLLGAVAFTFPYAKEAICGITPITQMVNSVEESTIPKIEFHINVPGGALSGPAFPLPGIGNIAKAMSETGSGKTQAFLSDDGGHSLVPIATPISLGGVDPKTLKFFQPKFQAMGLSVLQGAGGSGPGIGPGNVAGSGLPPLEPGSNIVIPLIRGDLDVSAGGTVTYIDGKKIYAFGHSLLDLGFTELPIHKARAILVFPSVESSFKILEMGEPAGTILQDRGMGVFGILGDVPHLIPLKVKLRTSRGVSREFAYELARDRFLTPLLVNLAVYNTIEVSERGEGVVTLDIQGRIRIKDKEAIKIYNRFSSDSGAAQAISQSAAMPVSYLMAFGYKDLDIEDIDLEIAAQENDRSALLDSIRLNRMEAKAGDVLELEISYNKADGEAIRDIYPLKIPPNIPPGPLGILVADGTTLMKIDDSETADMELVPRDLSQLIRLINNLRKNDRLYVRLFRREPGAVVRGEGLPGLPPTILSILDSDRRAGSVGTIGISSFMEYELPPADYMAEGSKLLTIRIMEQ